MHNPYWDTIFSLDTAKASARGLKPDICTSPEHLGVESSGMASSSVPIHSTNCESISNNDVHIPEHAVTPVLPADAKNAEIWTSTRPTKLQNLRTKITRSIYDSRSYPVSCYRRSAHYVPERDGVRSMPPFSQLNGSIAFTTSTTCLFHQHLTVHHIIGRVKLFFNLSNLRICAYLDVVDKLKVPPIVKNSFPDRFIQEIFSMERWIVLMPPFSNAIISFYTPTSDPWL